MSSEPASKRSRVEESDTTTNGNANDDKDKLVASLKQKVSSLQEKIISMQNSNTTYFASSNIINGFNLHNDSGDFPQYGMPGDHIKEMIVQNACLDFRPRLNTSSYVNVVFEPEETDIAMMGLRVNIADASVYPASIALHDKVVNMIATLWNAPPPSNGSQKYCGAGTVGSTEACLLAGLAHKFRWRRWYAARKGISSAEVQGVKPNIVISTCYQAAWEKFFRYFDVDPNFVKPNLMDSQSAADPAALAAAVNEKTIAVVGILGNHYNGVYDNIWAIDQEIQKINDKNGWQVGIHIDAASGGFIAPFQEAAGSKIKPFDFRLPNVLSISASGHKFGESCCGTGWVVFRQREDLAEHIAVSVSYLGGHCDSMTLNFSRPASGPYVQLYKFLRLGKDGYISKVRNQMQVSAFIRDHIASLKHPSGKPRFEIIDGADHESQCLPVVGARLNKELGLKYDDIDLQHALSESHWYVSGYNLSFENFGHDAEVEPLFGDVDMKDTMFRIVVKSNLTLGMAEELMVQLDGTLNTLDEMKDGYASMHTARENAKQAKAMVETGKSPKSVHTTC
jgi:glutamate decarboxylase